LAWVDEDRELLEELIAVFLEDAPIRLSAIRAAIQAGDGPNLREAAHTLKGSAAALGAFGARALAQELEDLGKDNALADAPAAAYRLEAELERVAAFLGR
jgi:HPt (histidine-containing phosphotransfer) domain-containing protein